MIRKTLLVLSVLATTLPYAPSAQASYAAEWFNGNWNCKIGDRTAQMNWRMAQDAPNSKYIGKFRESGGAWTPLSEIARYYRVLQLRFDRTKVVWNLTYSPDRDFPSRGVATGSTIVQGQRQPISCTKGSIQDEPLTPTDPQPPAIPEPRREELDRVDRSIIDRSSLDRCKQGYVWREAQPTDRVCVTPAVRTQTRDQNNSAADRREPNGGAYGPNTCKQGFVWREATKNDPVCVIPAVRDQAAEDNRQAEARRVP
jgi:Family of unknown function (DUF6006)